MSRMSCKSKYSTKNQNRSSNILKTYYKDLETIFPITMHSKTRSLKILIRPLILQMHSFLTMICYQTSSASVKVSHKFKNLELLLIMRKVSWFCLISSNFSWLYSKSSFHWFFLMYKLWFIQKRQLYTNKQ